MSAPLTFDALLAAAPDRPLYEFLDAEGQPAGSWTTHALRERAAAVGAALLRAGAGGAPVLVCTGPGLDQPAALFGCFAAGALAVPVYPPADAAQAEAIARFAAVARARVLLAPRAIGEALAARLGPACPPLVALEDAEADPGVDLPGSRPEDPAIVLFTSGSTGAPKGAVITHQGFVANLRALGEACGRGPGDVICSWLPHGHIAGLYTRLLPLVIGAKTVAFPATAFAARPTLWLETMSRHRCTMTAAPDFAYAISAQLFSDEAAARLDLSAWTMAVSGGELVREATVARFYAKFAAAGLAPAACHPYYGLTETLCTSIPQNEPPGRLTSSREGLRVGRLRQPADAEDAITLLGNGAPLGADTRVLAVDPETRTPAAPGLVGELWTRGPGVTTAYLNDPERTAEGCQARLADGDGPWFRTGDLGVVHEGQVYVTGRLKELIIVRGKNHYPLDLEATAMRAAAAWGVREAAAFAVLQDDGEEVLGLALEVDDRADADGLLRAVRKAVARGHGLVVHKLWLLPAGGLPRTATAKVSRARCRELADGASWEPALAEAARRVPATTPASALRELAGDALLAALTERLLAWAGEGAAEPLGPEHADRPIAELGLSSLALATVAAALRAETGVELPLDAFFDGSSLRQAAGRIAARLAGERIQADDDGWRRSVRRVAWSLPAAHLPLRDRAGQVFLTGATGFLGAWLLHALLTRGDRPVACLVRAPSAEAGLERLVRALGNGPGWDEAWRPRLLAVPGDVTRPRLGLDPAAWQALAADTAAIVHNAADVNFVAPYAALRPTNVDPVEAIAALALDGGVARPVHFVSTLAVFNATNRREQRRLQGWDRLAEPGYLYSGYAKSKWVAETAFRAAAIGGLPLCVHRPGLIIGASTTGQAHAEDFLSRMIKGCIQLGHYPDADIELDLSPVDAVAAGIAAAVNRPWPGRLHTCHWTCPDRVGVHDLFAAYRRLGHAVESEPLGAWLERVRTALPPDNALFPVHPFLFERPPGTDDTILEMLDGLPLDVDPAEAAAVSAEAGLPRATVDAALLDRMARRMAADGFLPLLART